MPPDDEPIEPPEWIGKVVIRLSELSQRGRKTTEETYRNLFTVLLSVEIDEFPQPDTATVLNTMIRLTWYRMGRRLQVDATPTSVAVNSACGTPENRRWIEPARRSFAWIDPGAARGHDAMEVIA